MVKTLILAIVLLAVFSVPAMAGISENWNNWSNADTNWQIAFTATTVFDLYQSQVGIENGGYENSPFVTPFIGEHPTPQQLYTFGAEWMLVNYVVARMLPPKKRRLFQVMSTMITFSDICGSYGTKIIFRIPLN